MKVRTIYKNYIIFDNGFSIYFDHVQECYEYNCADFNYLDDTIMDIEFDENLKFEYVDNEGFKFGDDINGMFFVPCYSYQNGYNTTGLDIYFNKNEKESMKVLQVYAQEILY